jgi:hypothetical protein
MQQTRLQLEIFSQLALLMTLWDGFPIGPFCAFETGIGTDWKSVNQTDRAHD